MDFDFASLPRYDDSNLHLLVDRPPATDDGAPECLPRRTICGGPGTAEMGLAPVLDFPDLLVDQKDWKEVIRVCHELELFPMYHMANTGLDLKSWYQNGIGYCWTWGLTGAVMGARAVEGQPFVLLSPKSNGYMVGWRNRGFYCDEAIRNCRERGIAPAEFVPIDNHDLDPRDFKAGWQQEALKYRPLEWWDTSPQDGALQMISQCLAVLYTGRPLYVAHNWWAHALQVVGMTWNERVVNNVEWLHWNSHGDGVISISGAKGCPDEAYGVRASTIAS